MKNFNSETDFLNKTSPKIIGFEKAQVMQKNSFFTQQNESKREFSASFISSKPGLCKENVTRKLILKMVSVKNLVF